MKLWLITSNEWWGYDTYSGLVVRASNESQARELASEKDSRFNDATVSTCVEVTLDGNAEIIILDFHAG